MKRRSILSYCVMFLTCLTIAVSCANPATQMPTQTDSSGGSAAAKADAPWVNRYLA